MWAFGPKMGRLGGLGGQFCDFEVSTTSGTCFLAKKFFFEKKFFGHFLSKKDKNFWVPPPPPTGGPQCTKSSFAVAISRARRGVFRRFLDGFVARGVLFKKANGTFLQLNNPEKLRAIKSGFWRKFNISPLAPCPPPLRATPVSLKWPLFKPN